MASRMRASIARFPSDRQSHPTSSSSKRSGSMVSWLTKALILLGVCAIARSIGLAADAQPAANVPTFEDVMVAPNDSHENGSFVNYMRGRLFVKNWTLRMLI